MKRLFDLTGGESANTHTLYKWRDAKGVIHYTSARPTTDIEVETIELNGETNIVPVVSKVKTKQHIPQKALPETVNADELAPDRDSP